MPPSTPIPRPARMWSSRRCSSKRAAPSLSPGFPTLTRPSSVLLDASLRRFRCQRIYLRATAAMRWINSRNAILRGQSADPAGLQNVDASLQAVSMHGGSIRGLG